MVNYELELAITDALLTGQTHDTSKVWFMANNTKLSVQDFLNVRTAEKMGILESHRKWILKNERNQKRKVALLQLIEGQGVVNFDPDYRKQLESVVEAFAAMK